MKVQIVSVVLCALLLAAAGDVSHLKRKARLLGRLASKHHKRGLSSIPTFKLGHDIPHVSHSVVKPFVVTYPPTAAVTAVKVPLHNPLIHHSHGHRLPTPHHHHFGLSHHQTKVVVPRPDQHFHHHHHHVSPRPVPVVPTVPGPAPPVPGLPLPPAPIVPVAEPTVIHPVPAPSRPVFVPQAPLVPAPVAPVAPPPVPLLPAHHHAHISPLFPAAQVPLQPILPAPVYPAPTQYVIRPGNAIQTSLFATYPRYPLVNFQHFQYPLTAPAAPASAPVFFDRPAQIPNFHLAHSGVHPVHGIVPAPTPALALEPTPTLLHPTQAAIPHHEVRIHPTQAVPIDHDGWSPVQPHDAVPTHTEAHFPEHTEAHFPQHPEGHFTQEQGNQIFEHHTDQQYHDYQHQLHQIQHQIDQHQLDQHQYEHHLNNQYPNHEYGVPQLNQEYGQPGQDLSQHGQDFEHHNQDFAHHEYAQHGQDFSQHAQDFNQHGQEFSQHGHDLSQGQEYALHQHLNQEYGPPQQVEGRSSTESDAEDTQRYHNHIPLGLQPPIDRPLEHFQR